MSFIESDAESFLDLIIPEQTRLERACPPAFDWTTAVGTPLVAFRDKLLAHLEQLVDWSKKMEEFFWNYGGQLLGQDEWMPATDSVQEYKARIRSLYKAIQANNMNYLKTNGLMKESCPTELDFDALQAYICSDSVRNLLHASRGKVSVMENALSVVIPFCTESPKQLSAV